MLNIPDTFETGKVSLIHLTPFTESVIDKKDKSYIDRTSKDRAESNGPFCYLLEIDNSKILLDCGTKIVQDGLENSHLVPIKKIIKDIDAILCTHPSLEHIGGLLFLFNETNLTNMPFIYMTVAASNMSNILLMDTLSSYIKKSESSIGDMSLTDSGTEWSSTNVKNVLSKVIGLRYSQPIQLHGKAEGITITAYPAGHTLGGAYWKIKKETEDILYAVNIHHKKERHLDGSNLTSLTYKPSVFIVDAMHALSPHTNRKQRDTEFIDTIINNLRHSQGNVLIPVDPVGRLLEILLLLESHWTLHKFPYQIYFLSSHSHALIDYVKSMMEWMGESILKAFSSNRENPFEFKYIKCIDHIEELPIDKKSNNFPIVVLATSAFLEFGPARKLFSEWMKDSSHCVIFTFLQPPAGTIPHQLLQNTSTSNPKTQNKAFINFKTYEKVPLEGPELNLYLAVTKDTRVNHKKEPDARDLSRSVDFSIDFDESDSDEDLETDHFSTSLAVSFSKKMKLDLVQPTKEPYSDASLWGWNQAKSFDYHLNTPMSSLFAVPDHFSDFVDTSKHIVFPHNERRPNYTPYGESLNPEEWPEFKFNDNLDVKLENNHSNGNEMTELVFPGELSTAINNLQKWSKLDLNVENGSEASVPSIPMKLIESECSGFVECSVRWIDFEGVIDGRSLKTLIQLIQPRKLVLIHGGENALQYLFQTSKLSLPSESKVTESSQSVIIASKPIEKVNISIIANMIQLKLSDDLLMELKFFQKNDYGLARVNGLVKLSTTTSLSEEAESPSRDDDDDVISTDTAFLKSKSMLQENDLLRLKFTNMSKNYSHLNFISSPARVDQNNLLIGEVKLPEFRRKLQRFKELSNANFNSGKLIIHQSLALSKSTTQGSNDLLFEGILCEDFYSTRDVLYDSFVRL